MLPKSEGTWVSERIGPVSMDQGTGPTGSPATQQASLGPIQALLQRPITLFVALLLLAVAPLVSFDVTHEVAVDDVSHRPSDPMGSSLARTHRMPEIAVGMVTTVGSFILSEKLAYHFSKSAAPFFRKTLLTPAVGAATSHAPTPAALAGKTSSGVLARPFPKLLVGAGATAATAARVRTTATASAHDAAAAARAPAMVVRAGKITATVRPSDGLLRSLAAVDRLVHARVPQVAKMVV